MSYREIKAPKMHFSFSIFLSVTDFEIIEKEEVTLDMKDPKITEYFQLVGTIAQERGLDYQVCKEPPLNKPDRATMRPDCVSAYIYHVTHMD